MAFFAIDELIALGHGRSLAKKAAAFFRNSFSCRSSRTSALSFAISADSEAFLRSWSVACAFLYLATQLPTVWGTRSYDEATEEMVRSFSTTSRTTCSLNSSEYLAAGIVFILSTHGKKNSPSPRNTTHPNYNSGRYNETIKELKRSGYDPQAIQSLEDAATQRREAWNDWIGSSTRIGETGGEAYLESQGYHIPDEFLSQRNGTAPGGWLDGMAVSPNGDEIVISEYKGVTANLDSASRPTLYEGSAKQGTPAYTRDRMLSDPRFAQYFHDHPDVWEGVKSGDTKLTIKVMKTKAEDLTQITDEPFTLTPEVIQHLQQNIDNL